MIAARRTGACPTLGVVQAPGPSPAPYSARGCCYSPSLSSLLVWKVMAQKLRALPVVDGNWGPWSPWGACSRTCGGGVHFSYRDCNDPAPQNGGKYCEGQRAKYQSCCTEECPPDGKSFREQQCAKYNSYNFTDLDGNLLEWLPKYSGVSPRDRCKLFCRAKVRHLPLIIIVIDGTLCGPETLSICVHGQCIKAGCDHVVGSSKKLDKCGVCGGNGSTCRKISGSLNRSNYTSAISLTLMHSNRV
uniref:ADAM metallopeptidase with thrombospondin type 1 motif 8 n=1 Tax=Gopherus evgoodei TaxID=1825980 RepID=A0A8C4Y584_9SAUR